MGSLSYLMSINNYWWHDKLIISGTIRENGIKECIQSFACKVSVEKSADSLMGAPL